MTWVNVFHAIERGDLETVQTIVRAFPRVRRATDKQDRGLFTSATRHKQVAILSFLASNGFFVDDVFDSMSGVEWAVHHGHLDVARFFLLQTDADIEGRRATCTPADPTPLWHAARMNHLEIVKLLLEFGVRLFQEDLDELKALDARTARFSPREIKACEIP